MLQREECIQIARHLGVARRNGQALAELPFAFPENLELAYAVQDAVIEESGRRVVGWKVGALPPRPDEPPISFIGPIFEGAVLGGNAPATVRLIPEGFAMVEVELILEAARPIAGQELAALCSAPEEAFGRAFAGFEINTSPLPDLPRRGVFAAVSDRGLNEAVVLGPEMPDWSSRENLTVELSSGGALVGSGKVSSVRDALQPRLEALEEALHLRGRGLAAGDLVASGAIALYPDPVPAEQVVAQIDGLPAFTVRFE